MALDENTNKTSTQTLSAVAPIATVMDAGWTYTDGSAKRKDFAIFWIMDKAKAEGRTFGKEDLAIIGKGSDDMPLEMNAETEESQDVLGNNNYDIVAYAETTEVTPNKVDGENKYAQWIDEAIEKRATLKDLEQWYLAVKHYKKDSSGNVRAWIQKGVVEPTSFAEGLNGISTTHTIHWVGERVLGKADPKTMAFTADTEEE